MKKQIGLPDGNPRITLLVVVALLVTLLTTLLPQALVPPVAASPSRPALPVGALAMPSASVPAGPDYKTQAAEALAALQSWYNPDTGLWDKVDWWHSANALETLIDFTSRSGNPAYKDVIANTFNKNREGIPELEVAPNFINKFYDDEGWWALAWLKAYDLTREVRYLEGAKVIFDDMTGGWDDTTCGGGLWWTKERTYKNAIANELFLAVAARLHLRAAGGNSRGFTYLEWAQKEWQWFKASGLINSANLINDGLTANACANNGQTTWTYNQGVILGGLLDLYKATEDATLLSKAESIAGAAMSTLRYPNGILREPCELNNYCGKDHVQFKGVFMRNLFYLYQTTGKPAYRDFITHNANSIWLNSRNPSNQLGLKWAGGFDVANASRQSAALDALNAALPFSVPGSAPTTIYEAENAVSNLAVESKERGYSGKGYRCCWNGEEQSISFNLRVGVAGFYRVKFRYSAGVGTASRQILLNGATSYPNLSFAGTGHWSNWSYLTLPNLSLKAGSNTLTLTFDKAAKNANWFNLDNLSLTATSGVVQQVEEGNRYRLGVETFHTGYRGKGYVAGWNSDGQRVDIRVTVPTAGAYNLLFRYAVAGGNATRYVWLNGNTGAGYNHVFPSTGGWNNWNTVGLSGLSLNAGENIVSVLFDRAKGSQNWLNLDELLVQKD